MKYPTKPPDWAGQEYVTCLGCGKRAYATKSEAKRAARSTARSSGEPARWWNVYQCLDSPDGCFHAGHRFRPSHYQP